MAKLGAANHLSKPKKSLLGMIGAASLLCFAVMILSQYGLI
jgi:hypothetical protein